MTEEHTSDRGHTGAADELADRADVEATERRLAFLYDAASTLFAAPLDVVARLELLAQVCLPDLADWCLVDLLTDDGALRRVAARHWDPGNEARARTLLGRLEVELAPPWLQTLLRDGRPVLASDPTPLVAGADRTAETLRRLSPRALMCVPLRTAGHVLGCVTFAFSDSLRRYDDEDLALAEDLCQRAALAVENARLFDREHQAREETQRYADRMARLQRVTAALSEALTSTDVATTIVTEAISALGARSGLLYALDEQARELRLLCALDAARQPVAAAPTLPLEGAPGRSSWRLEQSAAGAHELTVPLRGDRGSIGFIAVHLPQPDLSGEDRSFLLALAHECALALERARLYEAETCARRAAEDALAREAEARALVDTLLATAPIGLGFWDPTLRFVQLNETLREMFLLPPDAYAGVCARTVPSALLQRILPALERVVQTGEEVHDVDLASGGDGDQRHWLTSYYPVRVAGRVIGVGAVVQETTERKRAEAEREQLVGQLERAVQARDEFLSAASHELRTPLTAMSLWLQRTLRWVDKTGGPTLPADDVVPRLRQMRGHVHHLVRLIESLLDVSRITAGRLPLDVEEVDLSQLTRDVAAQYEEEYALVGASLETRIEPGIVGRWDRTRVEQVVVNFLTNALKYGANQPVELRLWQADGWAHLSVRDQGIGISVDDQQRIFERFERAVSEKSYAGIGVGLWIVNQIVRALGGNVRVESSPGEGSLFVASLPLAGTQQEQPAHPDGSPTPRP